MHLSKEQKYRIILIIENEGINIAVNYYIDNYYNGWQSKVSENMRYHQIKYRLMSWRAKFYNGGMKALKSNSGRPNKNPVKKKKPIKTPVSIREIWNDLTEEQRYEIFKRKIEQDRDKDKKSRMTEQDHFFETLPKTIRSKIWLISREGIRKYEKRGKVYNDKKPINKKRNTIYKIAVSAAEIDKNGVLHFRKGRGPISADLLIDHNIRLSSRMVGYYMEELGVKSEVRKLNPYKKERENKNTNVDIPNLLNRDYDRPNTISVDVKYIEHKSNHGNHAYIEPIIHLESKYILSSIFDYHQGIEQIHKNLESIDLSKINMFMSDHGSQYVSKKIQNYLKENNVIQSCSRVGNSLDNRVSEHWFGILQTECLKFHKLSNYNFEEKNDLFNKFIKYYNYERRQKKLGWLTPYEYWSQLQP